MSGRFEAPITSTTQSSITQQHHSPSITAEPSNIPANRQTRKRPHGEEDGDSGEVFEILVTPSKTCSTTTSQLIACKPYHCSHLDTPIRASTLALLPRASLPLFFLDSNREPSDLVPGRLFSSYIDSLNEESSEDNALYAGPRVLIARIPNLDSLYAIEKVREGVYTSCKLCSWVDEHQLEQLLLAFPPLIQLPTNTARSGSKYDDWWRTIELPCKELSEQSKPKPKKRKVETPNHIAPRPPAAGNVSTGKDQQNSLQAPVETSEEVAGSLLSDQIEQPSPQETFGNLIHQYLDALYISSASLAYLAKGALSRARAVFTARDSLPELSEFLRGLVLSVALADKRYKESIPAALKASIKVEYLLDGKDATDGDRPKPKKRRRAFKRGKDGLLPGEEEKLGVWWAMDESILIAGESLESSTRSRLAQVRSRETLIQLVLILETLALENASGAEPLLGAATQMSQPIESQRLDGAEESKTTVRPKKPRDLQALAESLVDRLTIWQSIEPAESGPKSRPPTPAGDGQPAAVASTNDQIKEFCLDVVMPFYGARLSQFVSKLSVKMGLPSTSPARPKTGQHKNASAKPAPGTALSRDQLPISRRTLNRVSSETSKRHPPHPPSLLRSATDSSLQKVKRERSERPKSAFSAESETQRRPMSRAGSMSNGNQGHESGRRPLSRSGSMSKSINAREVDMSAITKFNEARAKKRVGVEKELREAIAALKKPNRTAVGNEIVNDVEARLTASQRPTALTQRRSHLNVQVNATPKRASKYKDTDAATPHRAGISNVDSIPSSNPFIPSSAMRPLGAALMPHYSTIVSVTPSKTDLRWPQLNNNLMEAPNSFVPSSTMKARGSVERMAVTESRLSPGPIFRTPTKLASSRAAPTKEGPSPAFGIASTPTPAARTTPTATPCHSGQVGMEGSERKGSDKLAGGQERGKRAEGGWGSKSIYQSLGWDDGDGDGDDYDELT